MHSAPSSPRGSSDTTEPDPDPPARSWIFQARRDRFDILAAMESHDTDEWPVNQHRGAMHAGDRVYFWLAGRDGGIYGTGHILSPPRPSTATSLSTWHVTVAYDTVLLAPLLRRDLLRHPILSGLPILRQPQGTNFAVDETRAGELERMLNLAPPTAGVEPDVSTDEPVRQIAETLLPYDTPPDVMPSFAPRREAMRGALHLPDATLDAMMTLISAGRHLIITGPPGTGKTSLALQTAREAQRLGYCWEVVVATATADWTSFDTIGGYLPGPDGVLAFHEGVIPRALRQNAWLVLDEINRTDADRSLGPLLTLLSGHPVELPFVDATGQPVRLVVDPRRAASGYDDAGATYYIGQTWRIIGTMNADDRQAIYTLSLALARRFAVVRLDVPAPEVLREIAADIAVAETAREVVLAIFAHSPRRLGPALLVDILRYIAARDDPAALAEAVEAYVVPQLESIPPERLRRYAADLRRLLGQPFGDRVATYIDELFHLRGDR